MGIWEKERKMLYFDVRWLIFPPLSSYFTVYHTPLFSVVSYICLIKKTVSD